MAAIQLVKDKSTHEVFSGDQDAAMTCRNHCFENNLIMRGTDQAMIMSPPLTISKSEIDELLDKTKLCLDLTAKDLGIL